MDPKLLTQFTMNMVKTQNNQNIPNVSTKRKLESVNSPPKPLKRIFSEDQYMTNKTTSISNESNPVTEKSLGSRFKCKECGRSFKRKVYLQRHERTHTGERPFSCEICSATFAQSANLWYHMKTHTGVTPYQCEICSRQFRSSSHLKRHMRLHTGEKPYTCTQCPESFSSWDQLNRHKTLSHGHHFYL